MHNELHFNIFSSCVSPPDHHLRLFKARSSARLAHAGRPLGNSIASKIPLSARQDQATAPRNLSNTCRSPSAHAVSPSHPKAGGVVRSAGGRSQAFKHEVLRERQEAAAGSLHVTEGRHEGERRQARPLGAEEAPKVARCALACGAMHTRRSLSPRRAPSRAQTPDFGFGCCRKS